MNKKINIFALVISSLLIFSACNFSSNSGTKNIEKDGKHFVISGDILTGGQRSASTSFTLTSSHIIEITATHNADGVAADSTKATATVTGNKYSIVLDAPGEWNMLLTISVKNEKTNENDILYSVNGTINITDEGKILDPNDNQLDSSNINFYIRPDYDSSYPGSINLKIKDESGKIKKLSYSAELNGTLNTNSLSSVSEVTFENNEATISRNEVYPNSYKVKFNFDDDAGNTLYSCYEIVTVTAGFATDTWIGNGAHIRKDTRTGTTEFVITDTLIKKFGTDVVPVSKVLMYGRPLNENNSFNYYITDTVTSELPESVSFTNASYFDDEIGYAKNYSCFDSDGYYYVITRQVDDATYITSNKPDFGTNGVYMTAFYIGNFFSIDRKTGVAYAYNPDYSSITKLTEDGNWLDGSQAISYKLMYDDRAIRCDDVFAINDGVAYLTIVGESSSYFYVADLKTAIEDADGDLIVTVEQQFLPVPYTKPRVTDMLYQDGYVYLLLRYDNINAPYNLNFYSTGAVIRYNTFTKQFDETVLGLADAIEHDDEAYVEVKGDASKKFYNNNPTLDDKQELVVKAKDIGILNFYSPVTTLSGSNLQLSTKAFYGPQKFIAIKPKKLIISDDGIAFYTDAEGLYKYKNVNRVVIVDLEKFSAEDNEFECVATSLEFDYKEVNGSGYLESHQTSGSYWNFTLPYPIPVYTRDTKELYQNCIYCGEQEYMQNDSLKFFGETGDGGCGGRPLIRRED